MELLQRTLPETIEIEWNVPPDLWPVMVDQSQLESSILNLALNYRDAMAEGGTLIISCENITNFLDQPIGNPNLRPGEYVAISVKDTGIGIQQSNLDRIHDPFFTTKGVGKGSGLGLSMVYGFVMQSGGDVEVESEVGTGTTITLFLPRDKTAKNIDDHDIIEPLELPLGSGETILLVEDEPDIREVTIQQLRNLGYNIIDGGDGKTVLDNCREGDCFFHDEINLILSDVVLPNETNGRN